jgi:ferredoxin
LNGNEYLAPLTEAEIRYTNQGELGANERLACQVKIHGDVAIEVPEDGKLPHMQYSSE